MAGDSPDVVTNSKCTGQYSFTDFVASAVCYFIKHGTTYFGTGRYVGIMTTVKEFLQLCEVEVYSRGKFTDNLS